MAKDGSPPKKGPTGSLDPTTKGKSGNIVLRIGKSQKEKLNAFCKKTGRLQSHVAREAIDQFIDKHEVADSALNKLLNETAPPASGDEKMALEQRIRELEAELNHQKLQHAHYHKSYWQMRDIVAGLSELASANPQVWRKAFEDAGVRAGPKYPVGATKEEK